MDIKEIADKADIIYILLRSVRLNVCMSMRVIGN